MIIIGFCNLKGGVGKTTACQNIAVALSKRGKRIAVVDMDPQSNLSAGFGVTPSETDPQVFDLLSGGAEWDDIVRTKEGVDIIPSSLNFVMAELNNKGPMSKDDVLRNALKKVEPDRYDYILLDSPPQLGIFTQNVLAACSKIIVPMDGGFYSLFGLRLLDSSLPVFRERFNPDLEITGILMTNYNPRLYIARQIYNEVKKSFGDLLFESYIRQNVSIIEASSMGMSIFAYSPKSKGAEGYNSVTDELLKRLEGEYVPSDSENDNDVPEVPEPEPAPETLNEVIEVIDTPKPSPTPAPEPKPEPVTPAPAPKVPEPVKTFPITTAGEYEEGIKQDIIDMLPESEQPLWMQMLAPISDISRGEIDVRLLREDFEESDKDRYTFYILNDEENTFWPVMYPDQIIEPLRCVIKWDENGSAEVYM